MNILKYILKYCFLSAAVETNQSEAPKEDFVRQMLELLPKHLHKMTERLNRADKRSLSLKSQAEQKG